VRPSSVGDFGDPSTGLYPVEPSFTGLFTVSYSHPNKKAAAPVVDCQRFPSDPSCTDTDPSVVPARIGGLITDASGAVIANAKVTVEAGGRGDGEPIVVTTSTDEQGRFVLERGQGSPLPEGAARVTIEADGYETATREMQLKPGSSADLTVSLSLQAKVGQLRGVVQSFGGKPLRASISVVPSGAGTKTDAQGSFELDLEAGQYQVQISANGFVEQKRTVSVEPNGVTILNVDLRAAK